ncbi:hypothetical protein HDV00_012481 [Rhizophlyctis rosea]|nr:hypothetical protein HDV00_012481 [Rhizophlyctis rosea]
MQIPVPNGRARFGYANDYIDALVTSDINHANRLFHDRFYDQNDQPRFLNSGFDVEKRSPVEYATPALIQACNEVGEAVGFHCASLSADQYPHWMLHYMADSAVGKWGFGIEGAIQKLRNVGVTDLDGFYRADDVVIYHYSSVLGHTHNHMDISMKRASKFYLGLNKAKSAHEIGQYERPQLTDKQINYAMTDAQRSLEVPREVYRRMTPAQAAEATKYAKINSFWMTNM